jgi:hypothetical protein
VTATFTSFSAGDPGTCNSSTFSPNTGEPACVAFLGELFDLTGEITGNVVLELSFTGFANGSSVFSDYQTWNGTLSGHGSGAFILHEQGFGQPDGSYTSQLSVVEGTGSGDFAGVTGFGSSKGNLSGGVNTLQLRFPGH